MRDALGTGDALRASAAAAQIVELLCQAPAPTDLGGVREILEIVLRLTDSAGGTLGFRNELGHWHGPWTLIADGENGLRLQPAGCPVCVAVWEPRWAELERCRSPVIHNALDRAGQRSGADDDFAAGDPAMVATGSVGCCVRRSLSVPLSTNGELAGALHVLNRGSDYTPREALLLQAATRPLPALFARLLRPAADERSAAEDDLALALSYEQAEAARRKLERDLDLERTAARESAEALARLEQTHREILDGTPAVIYVKDLQGRYEFVNRRYEELFLVSRDDIRGSTDFDIFPADLAAAFQENDRRVAEAGEPLQMYEQAQHPDGKRHDYFSVKFPLRDPQGRVRAVAGISTDVTEKLATERQLDHLSRRHDLILNAVVDGVFGLDLRGRTTFINPAAVTMLGWTEAELLGKPIESFLGRSPAIAPPSAVWTDDQPRAEVVLEDEQTSFRTKSGQILPVAAVSRPLYLGAELAGTVVTFRDLTRELAEQEAAEQRAELERRQIATECQLRSVRQIQIDLFPTSIPSIPGFDIAAHNYPQHIVSGDFYDFIAHSDGTWTIIVGDASGHDLPAAVSMVEVHAALHTYLDCGLSLAELIVRLNRMLCRHLTGQFVSLFVTRLDPIAGRLEFAGAGHDATILRAGGRVETLRSTGLVLGLEPESHHPSFESIALHPGDLVLLCTDGFYEVQSPDKKPFGRQRMLDLLRAHADLPAERIIDLLRTATTSFARPFRPQDDMTAVIIRRLADALPASG